MSNFERLRGIIGELATKKLIAEIPGKTVRIRKKLRFAVREFKKNKDVLDSFSVTTAAQYLRCSPRYVKKMRSTIGKQKA